MDDQSLKEKIESDPFHEGLAKNGEFKGFGQTKMTTEELKASRDKLSRLTDRQNKDRQ